ncbi:MAG: hypothetical protein A2V62_12195 [Nitrospirae bacterium RBG_19FT_COMBO_58_9]|nr:MAG: hypothetical protein A2V62_12195 [Nitrospirae bacterium RBG_19FT_COMBO_58_9]
MFGEVQILVGKEFEMLSLHKMAVGRIEIRRGHESGRGDVLFQDSMGGCERVAHLRHNLRLGAKEVLIGH